MLCVTLKPPLAVVESRTEHVSMASEWMNLSQTGCCHFFQRGSGIRRERVGSEEPQTLHSGPCSHGTAKEPVRPKYFIMMDFEVQTAQRTHRRLLRKRGRPYMESFAGFKGRAADRYENHWQKLPR